MTIQKILEIAAEPTVNTHVQFLRDSFDSMTQKKDFAKVTFITEKDKAAGLAHSVFTEKQPEYIGIVMWIPATALPELSNVRGVPMPTGKNQSR